MAYCLNTKKKEKMDILKRPIDKLRDDLDTLNREWQDLDGTNLSASQCYHFETDPPHFLYNLNCPDNLKQKLKVNIPELNYSFSKKNTEMKVGQHSGMVGQHELEWWVNMVRNLH